MNLSKCKWWRALLYRVIAQKENRLILCLHASEKYEKAENVNKQNDTKQQVKNKQIKRKQDLIFVL